MALNTSNASIEISAVDKTKAAFDSIKASFLSVGNQYAALTSLVTGGAFAVLVKQAIEAGSALHDFSQKTGISVEALSGLEKIGRTSNTSLEQIAGAANKLSKTLAEGGNASASALKAIGLSANELRNQNPDQAMLKIAVAMSQFKDSGSKAAVAMALFGKGGAEILPLLNDLAEKGRVQATMTTAQADAFDNLGDKIDAMKGDLTDLGRQVASEVVGPATDLITAINGADIASSDLYKNKSLTTWSEDAAVGFARLVDVIKTIPGLLGVVGKAFRSVWADVEMTAAQSQVIGPGAIATLLRGQNPWAEWKKTLAERNAILADFNKDREALWDTPANLTEQGVMANIAARHAADAEAAFYKSNYASNAAAVRNAYAGYSTDIQQQAQRDLANASGYKVGAAQKPGINFDMAGDEAATKQLNLYNQLTESVTKFTLSQQQEALQGNNVTEGQKLALGILEQVRDGNIKLSESQRIALGSKIEFALGVEKSNLQAAESEKEFEARAKEVSQKVISEYQAQQAALAAYNDQWNSYLGGLEETAKSLKEQNDLYGLTATQIAAVNLQRAEETLAIAQTNGVSQEYLDRLRREVELRKEILNQTGRREELDKWKSIFESIDRTAHDTFVSIANGGKSTWQRLKDTAKNIFFDWLYQMTLKKWIFQIGAVITGTASTAAAADTLIEGQSGGGGSSFGNLIGTGKSLLDMLSKGNASIVSGIESIGAWISDGLGGIRDTIGGFIGENASAISDGFGYVGAVLALAQGKYATAIGTAIGTYFGGPIGGAIGNFVGGMIDGMFGEHQMRPKSYADYKVGDTSYKLNGAWNNGEGSDNKGVTDVGKNMATMLQDFVHAIGGTIDQQFRLGVKYMGKYNTMEFFTDANKDGKMDMKSYADLVSQFHIGNAEEQKNAISAVYITALAKGAFSGIDSYVTNMAKTLVDAKLKTKDAGAALQSILEIKQLHDGLADLPPIFNAVRQSIEKMTSIADADKMKSFASAVTAYYSLFYTDQEKLANSSDMLHTQFARLGLAFPDARAGFRAMVDGIDTTTDSGMQLFQTLVAMAPTMDQYYKSIEQGADTFKQLADSLSTDKFSTLADYLRAQSYIRMGYSTKGIPGFASGGSFGGGLRIVGENGPELEATGSSRIFSNSELNDRLRGSQSTPALIDEVRSLKNAVKSLHETTTKQAATMAKISDNTKKAASILDDVTGGGGPMLTQVAV